MPQTDLNLAPSSAEDASSAQQLAELSRGNEIKETPVAAAVKASDVDEGDAVADIQKKMKGAERFGMPLHLSEEEKRNSRAERYIFFVSIS